MADERAVRLPDTEEGRLPDGFDWSQTSYWKSGGTWYLHLRRGNLGNLRGHDVKEHEDGTITVSPSILITGENRRHGYLRRGEWKPCSDDTAPPTEPNDGE